ncbi:hypothetical protein [Streptomyces sp. NPDC037389]|uniref:hypothetical protein n=1 Tax=Streptomyces sp. NPDC037389 TaxID=3155369 RepID=UPI0033EA5329
MRKAPAALVAGKGPVGEPLVYVFYSSNVVRRILQKEGTGDPIESWNSGNGEPPVNHPFSAQPVRYSDLWPCLVGRFGDNPPLGIYRRDEQIGFEAYTMHALVTHGSAYRRVSWHHLKPRQAAHIRPVPAVPPGFTVTAAAELADSNVLLWGKTLDRKCAYCLWDPSSGPVGKAVPGPLDSAVTAAFLGYDQVKTQPVLRVYAGTDGKEETSFTVTRKSSSCTFSKQSAQKFLGRAEPSK